MELNLVCKCRSEAFFEELMKNVAADINRNTDVKVEAKNLRSGQRFIKYPGKKKQLTMKIESLVKNKEYKVSYDTGVSVREMSYEIEKIDARRCRVIYKQTDGEKTSAFKQFFLEQKVYQTIDRIVERAKNYR